MRGNTHFLTGLAAASCVPGVVARSAQGHLAPMLCAAAASLLPDFIDFRFARPLCRHDITITPDKDAPNPSRIARELAAAINATPHRAVNVQLNTCPIGPARWLSYAVQFQRVPARLRVQFRGIVDPGGELLHEEDSRAASAALDLPVRIDYPQQVVIGPFSGPTLRISAAGPNARAARFLPWHRNWSHAFPFWIAIPALIMLVDPLCGLCAAAGGLSHVLLDQAGQMGASLAAPFNPRRRAGWRWWSSSSTIGNATASLTAVLILLWRLHQ